MLNGFDDLTKGVGKAIETVPDLYTDALQPTIQETGKTLALIPQAINAALVPLRQWIAQQEYNLAETKKLLAQKLEHVDPEKIVSPEPYVAVPAIQAISYSMNSDELRNLYANLLAKAMNSDTKDSVHPSFVEIIKQLSPIDSLVFKIIMERPYNPIIDVVYEFLYEKEGIKPIIVETLFANLSDIDIAPMDIVSISIDNLIKQGLISIPLKKGFAVAINTYDDILNSQFYLDQQKTCSTASDFRISHIKKMIDKTHLGKSFYNICVTDL